jgi:pimeloyl-ACP methyl ester carboxylesterase
LRGDDYEKMLPELVKERKALMPKPNSYNELIEKLKDSWLQPVYVERKKAAAIKCPVLIVAGDNDNYRPVESFVGMYRLIPNSHLAVLPGYNHVDLIRSPGMFSSIIVPFLIGE